MYHQNISMDKLGEVLTKFNAEEILNEFLDLGLPLEMAKQCAIKTLRYQIDMLDLVDGIYFVGLKQLMDGR
jgi:hypothetical protein